MLGTLRGAGLHAAGRRGQKHGQILVLVWVPDAKIVRMVQRERHSDFLHGLPTSSLSSLDAKVLIDPSSLSPADRVRLVYEYITSTTSDGGLGIVPGSKEFTRLESIVALHNHEFNDIWMRSWTRRQIGFGIGVVELDKIKDQFGEAIALYFAFLSSYSTSLIYVSLVGLMFYYLKLSYSPVYSAILVIWSISFIEYWRIRQRILSIRWGTRGSFRVERRRANYEDIVGGGRFPWWKRDLRILASIPVILFFAGILAALLLAIFVVEAFVTQLYTGPGQKIVSFSPTILFIALVPRLLAIYQSFAVRLTNWENHSHQSSHEASLTLKTFALSAIVSYLGLALSAFVYMPFGEFIMEHVRETLSSSGALIGSGAVKAARHGGVSNGDGKTVIGKSLWQSEAKKTNPERLQNQMFAFTVTNQIIGAFLEVGLPFIKGKADALRSGKLPTSSSQATSNSGANPTSSPGNVSKKNGKRVVFEDEETGEKAEREFLAEIRHEVALPEYDLFSDYSEMTTQFGYVALWSTIWPLAPVMALLNNWLELRSDAFKIAMQCRRPIPARTDTIGPWLDSLGFITWFAALTNSALVYLFRPSQQTVGGTEFDTSHSTYVVLPLNDTTLVSRAAAAASRPEYAQLVVPALLIALSASHGYILTRLFIRHVLERVFWKGSKEEDASEESDRLVKEQYLRSLGLDEAVDGSLSKDKDAVQIDEDTMRFWNRDEGVDEIQKAIKDS